MRLPPVDPAQHVDHATYFVIHPLYLPFHIIMGPVTATLFAASFTRLARHD